MSNQKELTDMLKDIGWSPFPKLKAYNRLIVSDEENDCYRMINSIGISKNGTRYTVSFRESNGICKIFTDEFSAKGREKNSSFPKMVKLEPDDIYVEFNNKKYEPINIEVNAQATGADIFLLDKEKEAKIKADIFEVKFKLKTKGE